MDKLNSNSMEMSKKTVDDRMNNNGNVNFTAAKENKKKALIGQLHTFYHKWAIFVVKHRNLIMAICSIISTIGAVKISKTPFVNDINGWTPYGARSLDESKVWNEFFNDTDTGSNFGIFFLIKPKVIGANMLQKQMLEEVIRVDGIVNWNITLLNRATNRTEAFAEFCHSFCDINEPMRLFWKGFATQMKAENDGSAALEEMIKLHYPNINVWGRKANIQPHFHGITFVKNNSINDKINGTTTNMAFVEMVALQYRAERTLLGLSNEEMKQYLIRVSKFFENEFRSDFVRVLSISQSYVEAEFVRASLSMLPYLGVGFAVMAFCTAISIPLSAAYFQQATVHKVSLAIVACLCPFMATGTALGLLLFCGMRFSSILCVCPFLVLAIGVDAAFLMTHAWNRFASKTEQDIMTTTATQSDDQIEGQMADIMALVLKDTGPAILVSALANILADAIGCFIGSPEITLLCLGNMVALGINLLFQCTYFVAVMGTVAIIERKTRRNANGTPEGKKNNWQLDFHSKTKETVSKVVNAYVDLISNRIVASLIAFCCVLFIAFCAIGISNFEVNMTTKQLYARDSPLLEIDTLREQRIIPSYTMAVVFVNRPGNLSTTAQLAKVDELVAKMEALPESWGASSTMYFARDFVQFSRTNADDDRLTEESTGGDGKAKNGTTNDAPVSFDCAHLQQFLNSAEFDYWNGYIRLINANENNSQCSVDRFFFTTAFHNENLTKWSRRVELLKEWRKTVDKYGKEIDASVHHDEAIFLDLMDNMPTDTWQSAVATLVCMALICLVMLQDWRTVLVASAVIAAIIIETLGVLSWTGEALNQLMIGSLIISIGFSVDLPAHFSYHFLTAAFHEGTNDGALVANTFRHKLRHTIRSVGLPSVQASLSTCLCVLVDYLVDLYIARIFVRIMCLTIGLCLLNTLLVLPSLLTLTNAIFGDPKKH